MLCFLGTIPVVRDGRQSPLAACDWGWVAQVRTGVSGAEAMYLEAISTSIIILGLALTCYCLIRLSVSYRVVARYLNEHTPDQQQGDADTKEP